jgi:hypothetical protein
MRNLTDDERAIIAELNADADAVEADGDYPDYSGDWCHGCDNPVEECRCLPRPVRRETARRAIAKALELRPVVLRVDNDFFAVASSEAGQGYLLERDPASGDLYCPCKAAEFTGCCYHRAALGLYLGTIPTSWLPTPAQAEHVAVAS